MARDYDKPFEAKPIPRELVDALKLAEDALKTVKEVTGEVLKENKR